MWWNIPIFEAPLAFNKLIKIILNMLTEFNGKVEITNQALLVGLLGKLNSERAHSCVCTWKDKGGGGGITYLDKTLGVSLHFVDDCPKP